MNIQLKDIRNRLNKDDFDYVNNKILGLIPSAKASLMACVGFKEGDSVPARSADEFESVTDTYIVEYIRGYLDQIDNERTLSILAVQVEALLNETGAAEGGGT